MKFDIEIPIDRMRQLRGLFQTLLKVIFSSKENKASIFLVYFLQPKQIRFLVHSEDCLAILAVDPNISRENKSPAKEGAEILVIEFQDGAKLLRSLCELMEKSGNGGMTIALSKDRSNTGQQPFRSLNVSFGQTKCRNQVFKPQYDPQPIISHQWLNGCAAPQWRKVEFDIDTEHLLDILRLLVRMKELSSQIAIFSFHFTDRCFRAKLVPYNQQNLEGKFTSEGAITKSDFYSMGFKGTYTYSINADNAAKVYDLFMGKSSGSRLFIDKHDRIVFTYYNENVFESQVLLKKWMVWQNFEGQSQHQHNSRPKMET